MRIVWQGLVAIAASTLAAIPANAEADAHTFLAKIDSGSTDAKLYLIVLDAYSNGMTWANTELVNGNQRPMFCVPARMTTAPRQVLEILREYVKVQPGMGKYPAGMVLLQAYKYTFPCGADR